MLPLDYSFNIRRVGIKGWKDKIKKKKKVGRKETRSWEGKKFTIKR